jgi:hypothetical protein
MAKTYAQKSQEDWDRTHPSGQAMNSRQEKSSKDSYQKSATQKLSEAFGKAYTNSRKKITRK